MTQAPDYDRFAPIYNQHWGYAFSSRVLPIAERLVLAGLPRGARLLDLCCGTGQLAGTLTDLGYAVTGLDGSAAMLDFARRNAPKAEFILADARDFALETACQAATSTFDSLNHLLTLPDLRRTLACTARALAPGGLFLFDLNMEEGFRTRWRGSFGLVEEDHAVIVRGGYRPEDRIGLYNITIFTREEAWRRTDLAIQERCFSEEEVREALALAGFGEIRTYEAERDLNLRGEIGRVFFLCRKI